MFCRPLQRTLVACLAVANSALLLSAGDTNRQNTTQDYHVSHWTAEDKLPQNRITALAQTPDGYLWVGTWSGLARFDGVRFTPFNECGTPAMPNQVVNALAVDNEGTLWIGTADGLLTYRDGKFTRFTAADGLPDRKVWRLVPCRTGGVWLHSGHHVVLWRGGRPVVEVKVQQFANEHWRSLDEDSDGLVVAMSTGFWRVTSAGEAREILMPPGTPAGSWNGAKRQRLENRFWISTPESLWRFSDGTWQPVQRGNSRSEIGHFMYEDRSGSLWVNRSESGFWRCTGDLVVPVKLGEHRAEKTVDCMLEDREGNLWFGTSQGLFQLRPKLIHAVTAEDGLPHDECWSVCEGPDGAIWVETKGGVARIQDGRAQKFADEPHRGHQHSILVDADHYIWVGQYPSGLCRWRPGSQWDPPRSLTDQVTVEALYRDGNGHVWAGTSGGVIWFENGVPQAKWGEFGLPKEQVRSIYQTRDGAMWFGTSRAGAVRWTEPRSGRREEALTEKFEVRNPKSEIDQSLLTSAATRFTTAKGLADNRVFVFHEDVDGALWIGTHNGLSRFRDGRFFTFRTEHGLFDNVIHWLEEDEFGRFWISCNRGISRIDRRELNAVADGRKLSVSVAVYGTADGMPIPETNGEHQPAGCKGRDGRIWFPTPQGVVVIDPRVVKETEDVEAPPPILIEQVVADGEVIYGDDAKIPKSEIQNPTLPAGRGRLLKIRFTANSFVDPRRVRFQYRMVNHDTGWREATEERLAYYSNLRPGQYRFEVKAATPHGIWNDTPAPFEFSLAPYFWQTWPFYVFCGVTALGLAGGTLAARLRGQRRILRLKHQQAMEEERARLARDLHDELGTALTGLALEMDVARRGVQDASAVGARLQGMADNSRAMAARMREVVWAISPRCDDVPGMATFLEQHAAPFAQAAGLRCRLEFPEVLPAVPVAAEARHQLALGVREALTNVVRHARASEVVLSLRVEDHAMVLRVSDNGVGFDPATVNGCGHGLANLRSRLEPFGGRVTWISKPGDGTVVSFHLPLPSQQGSGS